MQFVQGEVAAVQRALGIATRVVMRRPLDDADQQRDLFGGQRIELAPEPELRSRRHTVDSLAAPLAHVHLVHVRLQDGAFVVTHLQDQGEQDLVELAAYGDFLADAQQAAAGQLLGQRAGALLALACGTHGDPERTHYAAQVDTVVGAEVAVFHRLQAGHQQLRHLLQAYQPAFFLFLTVQRGDAGRVKTCGLQILLAGQVTHAGNAAAGQRNLQPACRYLGVHVGEAAAGNGETAAVAGIGAGTFARAVVAIGGGVELGLERLRVHRHAGGQLQGTRIDAGRDLPLQRAETLADLVVQVQGVGNQKAKAQSQCRQCPSDQSLPPGMRVVAVFVVVVLVVVVVARHGDATIWSPASLAQPAVLRPP